jgi:hypothetical protein
MAVEKARLNTCALQLSVWRAVRNVSRVVAHVPRGSVPTALVACSKHLEPQGTLTEAVVTEFATFWYQAFRCGPSAVAAVNTAIDTNEAINT